MNFYEHLFYNFKVYTIILANSDCTINTEGVEWVLETCWEYWCIDFINEKFDKGKNSNILAEGSQ